MGGLGNHPRKGNVGQVVLVPSSSDVAVRATASSKELEPVENGVQPCRATAPEPNLLKLLAFGPPGLGLGPLRGRKVLASLVESEGVQGELDVSTENLKPGAGASIGGRGSGESGRLTVLLKPKREAVLGCVL